MLIISNRIFMKNLQLSVDVQSSYNVNKQQLIRGVVGKNLKNNLM